MLSRLYPSRPPIYGVQYCRSLFPSCPCILALYERHATFQVNHWHRRRKYSTTTTMKNARKPMFAKFGSLVVMPVCFFVVALNSDVVCTQMSEEVRSQMTQRTASLESHYVWMILECFPTETAIRFRKGSLKKICMGRDTLESFTGGQFIIERVRSMMPASEDTVTSGMYPTPASAREQQSEGRCQGDDHKGTDID